MVASTIRVDRLESFQESPTAQFGSQLHGALARLAVHINLSVHGTGDLGVRPPGGFRKASELKAFLSTPSCNRFNACESHSEIPRDARGGAQKIPLVLTQTGFIHEGLDGL